MGSGPFPSHLLTYSTHFLQTVFPRVPAATTTPAEGPPAKVSDQGAGEGGAFSPSPKSLWDTLTPPLPPQTMSRVIVLAFWHGS